MVFLLPYFYSWWISSHHCLGLAPHNAIILIISLGLQILLHCGWAEEPRGVLSFSLLVGQQFIKFNYSGNANIIEIKILHKEYTLHYYMRALALLAGSSFRTIKSFISRSSSPCCFDSILCALVESKHLRRRQGGAV